MGLQVAWQGSGSRPCGWSSKLFLPKKWYPARHHRRRTNSGPPFSRNHQFMSLRVNVCNFFREISSVGFFVVELLEECCIFGARDQSLHWRLRTSKRTYFRAHRTSYVCIRAVRRLESCVLTYAYALARPRCTRLFFLRTLLWKVSLLEQAACKVHNQSIIPLLRTASLLLMMELCSFNLKVLYSNKEWQVGMKSDSFNTENLSRLNRK